MTTRHKARAAFAVLFMLAGGAVAAIEADKPPSPDSRDRLDRVLKEWQRRSDERTSLDVRFVLRDRSPDCEDEVFTGRVVLLPGRRALVETKREGQDKAARTQRLIWANDAFHQLLPERKEHIVWPIAADRQGRLPAALALPFLWRVSPDALKARYQVALVKEDPESWILSFAPLPKGGSPSFSKALLQLDRTTCLPRRYLLIGPDGRDTKDYRVTEVQSNRPIPEEVLRVPDDEGWRVIRQGDNKVTAWLNRLFKPDLLP